MKLGSPNRIPRHEADVWLHPNVAGSEERLADQEPFRLNLEKGIAIYPDEAASQPHLPLLGCAALSDNNLNLTVSGEHRDVSLHSPTWFSHLLQGWG